MQHGGDQVFMSSFLSLNDEKETGCVAYLHQVLVLCYFEGSIKILMQKDHPKKYIFVSILGELPSNLDGQHYYDACIELHDIFD